MKPAGRRTYLMALCATMFPSRRTLPITRLLAVAACGAFLAIPYVARAEHHHPPAPSENKSLEETATLGGQVLDPPVGIEPDYILFHSGSVDLAATLRNDKTRGTIDVSVWGYATGTYSVSGVAESSGSTYALGSLTVRGFVFPIWTGTTPIFMDGTRARGGTLLSLTGTGDGGLPIVFGTSAFGSGSAHFGGKKSPLPDGLSPFDIESVSVSDSNGNLISTATLTPVSQGSYEAESPLTSGTISPDATGSALIRASLQPFFYFEAASAVHPAVSKAVTTGSLGIWTGPVPKIPQPMPWIPWNPQTGELVIHAHHLPASTALSYEADGTVLGSGTTDSAGNFKVYATQGGTHGTLPSTLDLFSVQSVTVVDGSGNVYVSTSF